MLARGAEGIRASDSSQIRFNVHLGGAAIIGNLVAADDSQHVLRGSRVLVCLFQQIICLGIFLFFPGM